MVEQEAVNFKVAGSSPAPGAINKFSGIVACQKKKLAPKWAMKIIAIIYTARWARLMKLLTEKIVKAK